MFGNFLTDALERLNVLLKQLTSVGYEEGAARDLDFLRNLLTFSSKDDVLTLLVHLGYLAFDQEQSAVFIPNAEIRGEFRNAIEGERWRDVIAALEQSDRLLQATWNQEGKMVAEILDTVHSQNTSILTYNDENSLSSNYIVDEKTLHHL